MSSRRKTVARRPSAAPPPPATAAPPPAAWAERRFLPALAIIGLLGLLVRGFILLGYVQHNPLAAVPINDAETYWSWAGDIARGQLTQNVPFFSAPLYPYLLGLLRALGGTLFSAYSIQTLSDIVTAILLGVICRRRFSATVGLLAAAMFLLLQTPASAALRILPGSLHLLLATVTWAVLILAQSRQTWWRLLGLGAVLGVLCLAYPAALLLTMPIAAWLFWQSGRRWTDAARAGGTLAVCALVIAPATWHNWRACGELFLIQAVSGITLAHGNQPNSDGVYTPIAGVNTSRERMHADVWRIYREATGDTPTWKKADRYFRDQALDFWRADPGRAIRLGAKKAYLFLAGRNYGDIYQPNSEMAAGWNRRLMLAPLPTAWLIGPALLGLISMVRRPIRHAPEWALFALPLLVVTMFWYSPRFQMPAIPIVVVAAAWAFNQAWSWRQHPVITAAVGGALVVGVALGAVNRSLGIDLMDPTNAAYNLAYAFDHEGDKAAAVEQLRLGLAVKPRDTAKRVALAGLLRELGRLPEAATECAQALQQSPNDLELRAVYADLLAWTHRLPEAREEFTKAVAAAPQNATLLHRLGVVEAQLGDFASARQRLEQAVDLDPQNGQAWYDLGVVHLKDNRLEDAAEAFRTALGVNPADEHCRETLKKVEQLLPETRKTHP